MHNQLKKISLRKKALGRNPLLMGTDIGSESHSVAFLNKQGELLGRIPKVYNSRKGFDYLLARINKYKKQHGFSSVHMGFEPTGHYWRNLAYYLQRHGVKVHFIKTTALKHQRELDDSSPSKNDDRDAVELGMLLREGKYLDSPLPKGVYLELRNLSKHRQQLMGGQTATLLRLGGFLDTYCPGLKGVFWSLNAKGLWGLLRKAPFPADVQRLGRSGLTALLSKASKRKSRIAPKVSALLELSVSGIGLPPTDSSRVELNSYLDLLETYVVQRKRIEKRMAEVIKGHEFCELLRSIPGIGVVSIATILGELGDPMHFNNANEVVSFCGYDPKEHSSGQYRSGRHISKKGRHLMRTMLYFMGMRVIHRNRAFKQGYGRKMKKGALKKKAAIVAVCIKLVRIMFAMLRDRKAFNQRTINPSAIRVRRQYRKAA
jgi:transposase